MRASSEHCALVALLREGRRSWAQTSRAVIASGSATGPLIEDLGLFAEAASLRAGEEIERWHNRGIELVSILDASYPSNLARTTEPPPLLFVAGGLEAADERAVAVVGSRRASEGALSTAGQIVEHLVAAGYTIVSGLATGIDTAVHMAALSFDGRTVAVIGTGLDHAYPRENATLQARIAAGDAVVSQFWPESPPTQRTFPLRNATMAGLALGTVIVEATHTSGTRIQARIALEQGRGVVLLAPLLQQRWAQELAVRPGVAVIRDPAEVTEALEAANAAASAAVPSHAMAASVPPSE